MVSNKKVTGKAMPMVAGLAVGVALSIGITMVLAGLTAHFVLSETISENAIGYAAMAALYLSAALGSLIAARMIKRRRMVVCLATGGIYFLTLLGMTALFFGGQYQGIGVTALVVLGGSGTIGLLGLRQGKGRGIKHKKIRSR
jgi:putative membrane protein (TIGR04086 family)